MYPNLIAKQMGLPVELFIAATNVNDIVPEYLNSGVFKSRPSIQTYSNAMDVGFRRKTTESSPNGPRCSRIAAMTIKSP